METWSRIGSLRQRIYSVRGRQAKPASTAFNLFKTSLQSIAMWVAFLIVSPWLVMRIEEWLGLTQFRFSFPKQAEISAILFLSGWIIAWMSAVVMVVRGEGTPLPVDATRKLVIVGPYRYVRNPMAFASLIQGSAIGFYFGSIPILLYIWVGAMMWNYLARPWEEVDLECKFGDEYRHYRQHVRCWAPRLRPYSPDSHVPASRSTINTT